MNTIIQDIRYAARTLRNKPGFTLVAVITLSLGIGANTAIFSVINAVLLRPLPFKDPARIVTVYERRENSGAANLPISAHEFAAWRDRSHSFESLALMQRDSVTLTGRGDPVALDVAQVTTDFFAVLGVAPLLGRTLAPGEDQKGANRVAILSQKIWNQRFGSHQDVINQSITLNDENYTVVGVTPDLELTPDVIVPIDLRLEILKVGKHSLNVIGRLKSGVTLDQAQADLAAVSSQLEQEMVATNKGHLVHAMRLHEAVIGDSRIALLTLFGAVGFVLLIACVNVANLLLSRAAKRQKEIAIRSALGASRLRLMRQTLTESVVLALLGGGLGLLSAFWIVSLIKKTVSINLPRLDQVNVDDRVLLATIGFSLFTGLLTGIAPAWQGRETGLYQGLIEGTRGSMGSGRRRIGNALVIVEIAMAVILLVGGGLMLKSFVQLIRVNPGFDPHQVLRLDLALPVPKYKEPLKQRAFYSELISNLKGMPGIESVGATTQTPLNPGDNWIPFAIEGRPAPPPGDYQTAAVRVVTEDYFNTMQIPLRQGRFFSAADARLALPLIRYDERLPEPAHADEPQAAPTVIINETMAKKYWPNEDPIGRRLRIIASPWITVVGIVGDVHHSALSTPPNPEMYLSDLQEPSGSLAVVIRTSGDPLSLAPAARTAINSLDKDLPVTINTLDQIFSRSVAGQRFNTLLLGAFACLALLLAMVGVFGVINYSVAQRTHELGIRLALGAQRRHVFSLVIGQGLILALIGVALGTVGALGVTRLIQSLLFGVSPTDALTFATVSVLVTCVALIACYLPARRATRVDPLIALRYE